MKDLYLKYRKWNTTPAIAGEGILVASDATQEWLLPWWWDHYQRHNSHPVAFVDLGLSPSSVEWCRERGIYIRLPVADIFVAEKEEVDSSLAQVWEKYYTQVFWASRNAWFKKPLALLLTPFDKTVWIDNDCEVRGSLREQFSFCNHPPHLALITEFMEYNAGVIVYKKGIPLIEEWADRSFAENHLFCGDEDVLRALIREKKEAVNVLPLVYNWSRCNEENR